MTIENIEIVKLDAQRYRWLRKQHWSSSEIAVVVNPKDKVKLGSHCPNEEFLDNFIDEAIGINRDACEWADLFANIETLNRVKDIIANDSFASGFQTLGQYRTAILKILND